MDGDRFIEIAVWMLSLILSIVFFYNGVGKIMGFPAQVAQFKTLGIPLDFMSLVGGLECVGALLLTIPRLALIGGVILGGIILGSIILHLFQDDIRPVLRAIAIGFMIVGICYLRFKRRHTNTDRDDSGFDRAVNGS